MARLFGTDGVRGLANGDVVTAELASPEETAAARNSPLIRDARVVERKKAGLKKARKASQFSKR